MAVCVGLVMGRHESGRWLGSGIRLVVDNLTDAVDAVMWPLRIVRVLGDAAHNEHPPVRLEVGTDRPKQRATDPFVRKVDTGGVLISQHRAKVLHPVLDDTVHAEAARHLSRAQGRVRGLGSLPSRRCREGREGKGLHSGLCGARPTLAFASEPTVPTTVAPAAFAICTANEPVAPQQAVTTTTSPARTGDVYRSATAAVCPETRSATWQSELAWPCAVGLRVWARGSGLGNASSESEVGARPCSDLLCWVTITLYDVAQPCRHAHVPGWRRMVTGRLSLDQRGQTGLRRARAPTYSE